MADRPIIGGHSRYRIVQRFYILHRKSTVVAALNNLQASLLFMLTIPLVWIAWGTGLSVWNLAWVIPTQSYLMFTMMKPGYKQEKENQKGEHNG